MKSILKNKKRILIFVFAAIVCCALLLPSYSSAKIVKNSDDKYWYFDYMDVWEAWNLIDNIEGKKNKSKDRVVIASIDSGINTKLNVFGNNVNTSHCLKLENGKWKKYKGVQSVKHGTAIASIIGAKNTKSAIVTGIATGYNNDLISMMCLNVYPKDTTEVRAQASTENIVKGIEYASEHGAKVIHMCLGHSPNDRDYYGNLYDDKKIQKAIDKAVSKYDVIFITSAGNNGDASTWYPSDLSNTLSVINTKKYTNAYDAQKCKFKESSYGWLKDVSAPGQRIRSLNANGTLHNSTGTSASSALVAGVAAMIRYANPTLSAEEVKDIICNTAIDLGDAGKDKYTGYGNVNAYNAVVAAYHMAGQALGYPNSIGQNKKFKKVTITKNTRTLTNAVSLKWKEPKNENIGTVNLYKIYRSDSKIGYYKLITTSKVTRFVDNDVSNKSQYYYKIIACGTSNDGKRIEGQAQIIKSK